MSDYDDERTSAPESEAPPEADPISETHYRGGASDPAFGFLVATAISIGLIPMLPANADLRYTLAWSVLALVGVLAWLLGNMERIGQETPENIAWGVGFGLLLSVPFVIFGFDTLGAAARLVFPEMSAGEVLAYLIFVMPLAETLFFRGVLQRYLDFWLVGLLATLWAMVLFYPVMWQAILTAPAVAAVIGAGVLAMNLLYSYVRERNGLAAAWITQLVAGGVMIFVPFVVV